LKIRALIRRINPADMCPVQDLFARLVHPDDGADMTDSTGEIPKEGRILCRYRNATVPPR